MLCHSWELQCCKSQVCLKILLFGIKIPKVVQGCLLQPGLCPWCCHCPGAGDSISSAFLLFGPLHVIIPSDAACWQDVPQRAADYQDKLSFVFQKR